MSGSPEIGGAAPAQHVHLGSLALEDFYDRPWNDLVQEQPPSYEVEHVHTSAQLAAFREGAVLQVPLIPPKVRPF